MKSERGVGWKCARPSGVAKRGSENTRPAIVNSRRVVVDLADGTEAGDDLRDLFPEAPMAPERGPVEAAWREDQLGERPR